MVTGAAKPPRTVPESVTMVPPEPAQATMTAPEAFTARSALRPPLARLCTAVQVPPAARLAVSIPLLAAQTAIAFPFPSTPISGGPASLLTVTGLLHDPFGGRTLAWIVPVMGGRPSHTATARPSGASATAGLTPPPKVVAADQAWPFALVRT